MVRSTCRRGAGRNARWHRRRREGVACASCSVRQPDADDLHDPAAAAFAAATRPKQRPGSGWRIEAPNIQGDRSRPPSWGKPANKRRACADADDGAAAARHEDAAEAGAFSLQPLLQRQQRGQPTQRSGARQRGERLICRRRSARGRRRRACVCLPTCTHAWQPGSAAQHPAAPAHRSNAGCSKSLTASSCTAPSAASRARSSRPSAVLRLQHSQHEGYARHMRDDGALQSGTGRARARACVRACVQHARDGHGLGGGGGAPPPPPPPPPPAPVQV